MTPLEAAAILAAGLAAGTINTIVGSCRRNRQGLTH
jgi:hypothetical protein